MRASRATVLGPLVLVLALGVATFVVVRRRGRHRELEPQLAAMSRDGQEQLLIAWMSASPGAPAAERIALATSTDGGAHLVAAGELASPDGRFAADPTVVFAPTGESVVTWLGFRANVAEGGDAYDMRVYAARSAAGSARFGAPRELTPGDERSSFDRPVSAVGADGRHLVAVRFERAGRAGIALLATLGVGPVERRELAASDGFGAGLPCLCVGAPTGVAHVAWLDPITGITLARDARSDAPPAPIRVSRPGEDVALEAPSCVAERDELWLSYALAAAPIDSGASASIAVLVLLHSPDRGATFDRRVELRDGASVLAHPALVSAPGGGVTLVYYAASPGSSRGALRRASVSADGTIALETLRTDLAFALRRTDPAWLGDYIGLARTGDHAYVAFGDVVSGLPHVLVQRAR